MPTIETVKARLHEASARKAARETMTLEERPVVALEQIAEAIIALQADIQDLRTALQTIARHQSQQ